MGRRFVGIGAVLTAALVAACGGGTSAEEWASAVCNSGGDWVDALQSEADALQSTVESASPEEAKQLLLDFLDGTIDETDELLTEIENAGTPDAEGGEAFANDVEDQFGEAREALENARDQVAALSPSDPETFSQKASELGSLLGQVLSNFEPPNNQEMEQAFEDAAACNQLSG